MLITTKEDSQRLLPVRMALRGSWNNFEPPNDFQNGWSIRKCVNYLWRTRRETYELQNEAIRKIFTRFQESPILHCEDTLPLGKKLHDGWTTRRFADAWRLEFDVIQDLTMPHSQIASMKSFHERCEVFTQADPLAKRIVDVSLVVEISGSVPTHPFELLRLESLELRKPLASPDGEARLNKLMETLEDLDEDENLDSFEEEPPEMVEQFNEPVDTSNTNELSNISEFERPDGSDQKGDCIEAVGFKEATKSTGNMTRLLGSNVNGTPSCRLFKDCNIEREADSNYCTHHSRALITMLRQGTIRKSRFGSYLGRKSFDEDFLASYAGLGPKILDPARLGPRDYEGLVELRRLVIGEPRRVWIVDAEFQTLSHGKSPFVMEFAARNARNEKMVDFHVDYEGSHLKQVLELVLPFVSSHSLRTRSREFREDMLYKSFVKNYRGFRTHGIRISDARKAILAAGYDRNTQFLLSWGTTLDFDCFEHLLSGDDSPVVDSVAVPNYINIMNICRHMLPPTFPSMSLRVVDQALRQGPPVMYHQADMDVFVTCHIVHQMVNTIRPHAVRREVGHSDVFMPYTTQTSIKQ